jgi:predicted dehydrogenase
MKRRQFLGSVARATLAASAGALAGGRVLGANERVNVGIIGCGGRGKLLTELARKLPEVEVVAACDVYERQTANASQWAGPRCRAFGDFRRLLELKEVDAVFVATPDHWHAIQTILACQAGKDVFVEKPLAHTIREGRAMVEAARRHRRVVQTGTQHRSAPHYREVQQIIQSGELGPVRFARIWNYLNMTPAGIGRAENSDPPPGVDWDLFLGPAPRVPFNRSRFVGTYRWFWDYGGGMPTDFGTHRFDSFHQVMGVDAPLAVTASGGRFVLDDGAETPDVIQITYEYPGVVLSYEALMVNAHGTGGRTPAKNYYLARGTDDRPHGEAFYGPNGSLFSDRVGFEIYPELKPQPGREASVAGGYPTAGPRIERREVAGEDATDRHVKDFIECVRTRRKPVADVEIGHRSTIVAHLGNIAYRTGRKIRWDAEKEEIVGDAEASKLLTKSYRKPWDILKL